MSLTVKSSSGRFPSTQPYAVLDRKERSRELAQKRRSTYKTLMQDLADELPFSKDVVSQVDYNSRLRLALCFFRAKNLLRENLEDVTVGRLLCIYIMIMSQLLAYMFTGIPCIHEYNHGNPYMRYPVSLVPV